MAVQEVLLAHPRKAREVLAVNGLICLRPHEAVRQLGNHPAPQVSFTAVDTCAAQVSAQPRT